MEKDEFNLAPQSAQDEMKNRITVLANQLAHSDAEMVRLSTEIAEERLKRDSLSDRHHQWVMILSELVAPD